MAFKKYDPTTNPFDRRFKGDITKMGLSSFTVKKMQEKGYTEDDKLQTDTSLEPARESYQDAQARRRAEEATGR